MMINNMDIQTLKNDARNIWPERLDLPAVVVRLGVTFGDLCRHARQSDKDKALSKDDLKKELGNVIFSTIRWCDDLGFDPEECIALAKKCQEDFAVKNSAR